MEEDGEFLCQPHRIYAQEERRMHLSASIHAVCFLQFFIPRLIMVLPTATSCDAGSFYNSSSLVCEQCTPGFYSLGGGLKISAFNWTTLKEYGFRINTEPRGIPHCTGWKVRDQMLESTASLDLPPGCISIVSYTVKVVKKGKLRFSYQYRSPDDFSTILFTFQYRNYEDIGERVTGAAGVDAYNIKFPSRTREQQKWNMMELTLLKPGLYIFIWKSLLLGSLKRSGQSFAKREVALNDSSVVQKPLGLIRIKSIEINGIAYASKCTPCEPGTYTAGSGSPSCKRCPRDTYSNRVGSFQCTPCNATTHYSEGGSTSCSEKPQCTENDYYEVEGECDEHTKKQRITAKWIEPKICRNDSMSISFTRYKACNLTETEYQVEKSCSPGMEFVNSTCQFCPENHYRNRSMHICEICPPSSLPEYSLILDTWRYPTNEAIGSPSVTTQCMLESAEYNTGCELDGPAWSITPAIKSYIRSASNAMLDALLLLTVNIDGFKISNGGELRFTYELICSVNDDCHFLLAISKGLLYPQPEMIIEEWKGSSNGIKRYTYKVEQNTSISFMWVFKREKFIQSHARIYDIVVTNAMGAGAIRCSPCVEGSESQCVLCPKGHYLSFETQHIKTSTSHTHVTRKVCVRCPVDTIINTSVTFPVGREKSCVHCGPGLKSNYDNTECHSDCVVNIDGNTYDLSKVKQPIFMKGAQLFTSGGIQYYHFFNITLCGSIMSVCTSNSSGMADGSELQMESVSSLVCRSTVVPDPAQSYTTQPVSLGDKLVAITKEKRFQSIEVHPDFRGTNSDLHLYYQTEAITVACKKGRTLVVTMRCAPEMDNETTVSAPASCADGTCDGCNFHFLVKTSAACRTCNETDYDVVVGECSGGFQDIHYINPRACIIPHNSGSLIKRRQCSVVPRQVQIGIMLISSLGIVLLALVFHFWKKNRRLEYKYSKLVENKNTADCCVEDDDDDDEDIKIRQPRKEKADLLDGYETIHLTKQNGHDDVL